jgi:hypothetical protein
MLLFFSDGNYFDYYEEYPINLVQRFTQYTGKHEILDRAVKGKC